MPAWKFINSNLEPVTNSQTLSLNQSSEQYFVGVPDRNRRWKPTFCLGPALVRLKRYFVEKKMYSVDFEDEIEGIISELNTNIRCQLGHDEAKPKIFKFALTGSSLAFYKSIGARSIPWSAIQSKFKNRSLSQKKKEIITQTLKSFKLLSCTPMAIMIFKRSISLLLNSTSSVNGHGRR